MAIHRNSPLSALDVFSGLLNKKDIAVLFDLELRYVFVNDRACQALKRKQADLIGNSIVDLYPEIVASQNHRNLLRARSGETVSNFILPGKNGDLFSTSYYPVFVQEQLTSIFVHATLHNRKKS